MNFRLMSSILFVLPLSWATLVVAADGAAKPAASPSAKAPAENAQPATKSEAPAVPKPKAPIDPESLDYQSLQPENPGRAGDLLPFTIDVPRGWQGRPWANGGFVAIGPAGQEPAEVGKPQNPWIVAVRISKAPFPGADVLIKNLQANAAQVKDWKLLEANAHDFGGMQGILVVMQSGLAESERITYTAKVPYGDGSLDVITSAPLADFPNFRPLYDRILLSLQRATTE